MYKHTRSFLLAFLFVMLLSTGCGQTAEGDQEAFHMPTQKEQLEAKIPPTTSTQEGAQTIMRRGEAALTVEALEDGQSYRLTPTLEGVTPPNIFVGIQGIDQSCSYLNFPEGPGLNFDGAPDAVLTLDTENEQFADVRCLDLTVTMYAIPCETVLEIPLDGSERTYDIDGHQVQLTAVDRRTGGYSIHLTPVAAENGVCLFSLDLDTFDAESTLTVTSMNDKAMTIEMDTKLDRSRSASLQVKDYTLTTGHWLYELSAKQ